MARLKSSKLCRSGSVKDLSLGLISSSDNYLLFKTLRVRASPHQAQSSHYSATPSNSTLFGFDRVTLASLEICYRINRPINESILLLPLWEEKNNFLLGLTGFNSIKVRFFGVGFCSSIQQMPTFIKVFK